MQMQTGLVDIYTRFGAVQSANTNMMEGLMQEHDRLRNDLNALQRDVTVTGAALDERLGAVEKQVAGQVLDPSANEGAEGGNRARAKRVKWIHIDIFSLSPNELWTERAAVYDFLAKPHSCMNRWKKSCHNSNGSVPTPFISFYNKLYCVFNTGKDSWASKFYRSFETLKEAEEYRDAVLRALNLYVVRRDPHFKVVRA
tara:strand:+ start:9125 stop:9721 length:597 start_codon:yes stop_codon:yes gene_type:complete